jgi:hypothetical protein
MFMWRRGACCVYGFSRDAQLQASVNTSCCICTLHYVMEISKSPKASHGRTLARTLVFYRGDKCHCQVAEVLLHKYKEWLKVSAEYAITRPEPFSCLSSSLCLTSLWLLKPLLPLPLAGSVTIYSMQRWQLHSSSYLHCSYCSKCSKYFLIQF